MWFIVYRTFVKYLNCFFYLKITKVETDYSKYREMFLFIAELAMEVEDLLIQVVVIFWRCGSFGGQMGLYFQFAGILNSQTFQHFATSRTNIGNKIMKIFYYVTRLLKKIHSKK